MTAILMWLHDTKKVLYMSQKIGRQRAAEESLYCKQMFTLVKYILRLFIDVRPRLVLRDIDVQQSVVGRERCTVEVSSFNHYMRYNQPSLTS